MQLLASFGRLTTLLITWGVKLLGLLSAADQLLLHTDHISSIALLVSAWLITGAQFSESLLLGIFDRLTAQVSETNVEKAAAAADTAHGVKRDV